LKGFYFCPRSRSSHNSQSDAHGYTVGINQFADMSSAEFKKVMLT
jgi:hypothetical protein